MPSVFILDFAYAAGVALSPTPIVVVILMLFSQRGRPNALAFLLGWVVGLGLLVVVLLALTQAGILLLQANTVFARPAIQILLGLGVIWLAHKEWGKVPRRHTTEMSQKWMGPVNAWLSKSSDKVTPGRAFVLAILMSSLSPKNIALMLAIVLTTTQADLQAGMTLVLFLIFVFISSVTVGIPVLYALLKGQDADEALNQWKDWVIENRGRALALLLLVLGGILVFNGIVALLEQFAAG